MQFLKISNILLNGWLLFSILLVNSCTCSPQPEVKSSPKIKQKNDRQTQHRAPTIDELVALLKALIAKREKAREPIDGHKNVLKGLESIKSGGIKPTEKFVYKYPDGGSHQLTLSNLAANAPDLDSTVRVKLFEYIKAQGGSFKEFTPWGESILHLLVKIMDVNSLEWLLKNTDTKDLVITQTTNYDKETPLKIAVLLSLGDTEKAQASLKIIALLLKKGAAKDKAEVQRLYDMCERKAPGNNNQPNKRGANKNGEVATLLQQYL